MFASVVIPTLNEEKFLPKLLNDFKKQSLKDFEVIIVDGKSEDKTLEKAKKFKKFLDIKIIIAEKRNVSYQRNLGAKNAKGKYIVFLDADSRIKPGFMKKLKKTSEIDPGLIYITKFEPDIKTPDILVLFELSYLIMDLSRFSPKPFSFGGSIIFEKNFFHFLGGFDESVYLSEDHEIIHRAKKAGVTAKIIQNIKITFCLRRLQREGKLKFFAKLIVAGAQTLLKEKIDKPPFEYQMGGHLYKNITQKNFIENLKFRTQRIKELIKKTENIFKL